MESPLFFSQLVLFALLWLFIILHLPWPQRAVTVPAAPAQPKRSRSTAPTPFAGLTHKPPCALCERDSAPPQAPPPVPPAPCPRRTGGPVRSTPLCTFVPMLIAITEAGAGWGICTPTVIPVAAPGGSSTVSLVKGTFWRPTARLSTAHRRRWNSSCASEHVWPKVLVSAPPRGCSRSPPTRCCTGWSKRPSSSAPF